MREETRLAPLSEMTPAEKIEAENQSYRTGIELVDLYRQRFEFCEEHMQPDDLAEFREVVNDMCRAMTKALGALHQKAVRWRGHCLIRENPALLAHDEEAVAELLACAAQIDQRLVDHYASILARHRAAYRAPLRLVKS